MEGLSSLIFLALLIFVFYFLLIRPQKKRVEEHRKLVESTGLGDEVVTIGGIRGQVTRLGDEDLELEVADGIKIQFVKSAIARRVEEELETSEEDEYPVEEGG